MTAAVAADGARSQGDELLARARAGDAAAFGEIVREYQAPVYRAALAVLGSPAEAEDAAQDAFVAAFRRLASFRGEAALKTWLVAIAWRKALTRRRRLQWLRTRTAARTARTDVDPIDLAVDPADGPQSATLDAELRRQIRTLVRSLPSKLRDALLLVAGGDHSYDEAAAILRVPVGTAKWRVAEARRVLRAKLRALGYR